MAPIGRWALANPDFVARYRLGEALAEPDLTTFYAGGANGYTDYPMLTAQVSQRAARISDYGGQDAVRLDGVPIPEPKDGQVLVRVTAAGINGLDWKVREGYVRDAFPLALPATLGIELAGVVVDTAGPVAGLRIGDRVAGPIGGLGAYADYVAVDANKLARIPDGLSDIAAASIPVAAMTAWQTLQTGKLVAGQSILIHGAAGGVGSFAVQFAKQLGATVLATASASSRAYVESLGADVVIDRHAERFDERLSGIDLVLDLVGGDTLQRSWRVLAPGGVVVSTAAPDIGQQTPAGYRGIWFMTRPDPERLAEILQAVSEGRLKSQVAETVALSDLPAAIERNRTGHAPGKMVVVLK
jgi:N-ethylmaleimide reductase